VDARQLGVVIKKGVQHPLLEGKRTSHVARQMSAFAPKQPFASLTSLRVISAHVRVAAGPDVADPLNLFQ
jgi:hypothetical protein